MLHRGFDGSPKKQLTHGTRWKSTHVFTTLKQQLRRRETQKVERRNDGSLNVYAQSKLLSVIFQPCTFVRHFPVRHFPALHFCPSFSTPAFSSPIPVLHFPPPAMSLSVIFLSVIFNAPLQLCHLHLQLDHSSIVGSLWVWNTARYGHCHYTVEGE